MSILLLAILISSSSCSSNVSVHNYSRMAVPTPLHIITVLSVEEEGTENSTIPWIQGRDIFNGACQAAKDINQHPDLLQQFEVVPVPVFVSECDPVKGFPKLVEALTDRSMNIRGVTGMFCDGLAEVYSPVLIQWEKNVHIPGEKSAMEDDKILFTSHPVPSHEEISKAVMSLLYNLNWTRFGLVHVQAGHNNYKFFNYLKLARALRSEVKTKHGNTIQASLHYELRGTNSKEISLLLQALESSEYNVFVMLVPLHTATAVIQKASKEVLMWPQYVWIFVLLEPATISLSSPVWDNVIFMSYRLSVLDGSNIVPMATAAYTSMLYNSVWRLVLEWNNTSNYSWINRPYLKHGGFDSNKQRSKKSVCNLTFPEKSGKVKSKVRSEELFLDVSFIKQQKAVVIGHYDLSSNLISLNHSILSPVPPDRFSFVYIRFPLSIVVSLSIWIVFVYILLAVNLLLFLIFRNEHEVKASSVPLSMCIFVGSYMILVPPTNHVIEVGLIAEREKLRHYSCNVDQMSASVGLDIVVATALVRTLRIYHIFHHFKKLTKRWTDSRLVIVILAIVFIKVGLFVLWISMDNHHLVDTVFFQGETLPPHYLVIQSCYSHYQIVWTISVYTFTFTLLVLLFILAVKTRKISRSDFKDTKKTSLLVLIGVVLLVVFGSLWGILRSAGQHIASYVTLSIGYSLCSFIIQVFLFTPKVLPPLYRHFKNYFEHE